METGIDAGTVMHVWAMATAAVVSASCALCGSLLVVRRMSLVGDAIAHAVLPGIAVAVLAGGRPGGVAVFLGAVAAALVTVWLAHAVHAGVLIDEDAAAGVVFTTLFAGGVVLVTVWASRIDLDAACVLHGILELVPFDTMSLGGLDVPRGFIGGLTVLGLLAAALAATWNLQLFTAFDAAGARVAGVPVAAVTNGLLAATAVATVAGFQAVGAILVVAMLVAPAAAAELLTRRLHRLVLLAMLLAAGGAVLGYLLAWRMNTSAAGMIAVVLGLEYLAAALCAPGDGLVARVAARIHFAWRVAREDALARIWRMEEAVQAAGTPARAAPAGRAGLAEQVAVAALLLDGSAARRDGRIMLTDRGRRSAETIVRSHRLWEAWLGRHAEVPLDHLHPPAEWMEHHLGVGVRRRIEAELGVQENDPHGRDIPPEA